MIVLDTNVLSALMQLQPDAQVVAWLDGQPAESIWLSTVTVFEARYGLALLADGQRKHLLQQRLDVRGNHGALGEQKAQHAGDDAVRAVDVGGEHAAGADGLLEREQRPVGGDP